MIAIDDADETNGCLEIVEAMHAAILPMDDKGCIAPDVVESMTWTAVPVQAGQVLWFHSRTPHRSGANTSSSDRRAIYPTYNALREGDLREAYYAQKSEEFRARGDSGGSVQVSLIGDFQGIPV
jgi:ectoine hydroxylase-related dioxygenase (phytanoyl-CoA dioxygenase family)